MATLAGHQYDIDAETMPVLLHHSTQDTIVHFQGGCEPHPRNLTCVEPANENCQCCCEIGREAGKTCVSAGEQFNAWAGINECSKAGAGAADLAAGLQSQFQVEQTYSDERMRCYSAKGCSYNTTLCIHHYEVRVWIYYIHSCSMNSNEYVCCRNRHQAGCITLISTK